MSQPDQTLRQYKNLWIPPPKKEKPAVLPVEMLKAKASSPCVMERRSFLHSIEQECRTNNWKLRAHATGWVAYNNRNKVVSVGLWTTNEECLGESWIQQK
jgi:hypothetical protein